MVVGCRLDSPTCSATMSPTSSPSLCMSNELNQDDNNLKYFSSPKAISMVLVGCSRCLMYVMVNEDNLKCPKSKSIALIHFVDANNNPTIKKG
ncbi:hypothetical protein JHK87_004327 [Glycine soja]|nr:hypothetical protein JHK87_004327 [Glycine soja]